MQLGDKIDFKDLKSGDNIAVHIKANRPNVGLPRGRVVMIIRDQDWVLKGFQIDTGQQMIRFAVDDVAFIEELLEN